MAPLIYIRDVNNLSDARYCAAMGADLIGFRLDPAKEGYLKVTQCKEIAGWISGIKIVAEPGDTSSDEFREILTSVNVDFILAKSFSALDHYESFGKPLIIQVDTRDINANRLNELSSQNIAYILLTSESKVPVIPKVGELHPGIPVILGFGITTANVSSIIDDYGFAGISLKGGSEERPGYKDYDEMADILEILQDS